MTLPNWITLKKSKKSSVLHARGVVVMKRVCIKSVLILLVCFVVPVLVLSACTPHEELPGKTEPGSFPAQEHGDNDPETAASTKNPQSAKSTPVPDQKYTPEASGVSNPSETMAVSETEVPSGTDGASATVEATNTGTPAETAAPFGTDTLTPGKDPTPTPSKNTPDPATASPGTVHTTKDPRADKTPKPSDIIGPVKPSDKPKETVPGQDPGFEPTPTPGSGIYIDENGNIILPEIPIP